MRCTHAGLRNRQRWERLLVTRTFTAIVTRNISRTHMPRVGLCLWNVADLAPEVSPIPSSPFKVHDGAVGVYHDKRSGHWYVKYTSNKSDAGRVQVKHGTFVDAHVAWATARWLASQPRTTLQSASNKAHAFRQDLCTAPSSTLKRPLELDEQGGVKRRCVDASSQTPDDACNA